VIARAGFGPYVGGPSKRGLWNAAKDLLFAATANVSRIADKYL
jgi:hypothetical protein